MPDDIKTTNIRLPMETWKSVNHILVDQGGKESLNALIIRLLDDYVAKEQKKKK
jgi:hypothetical protein